MTVLGIATLADLLRLLVVPAFAWAAYRDVRTRRLPNRLWPPLLAIGLLALALDVAAAYPFAGFEGRLFLVRTGFSLLFLVPFSVLAYRLAAFGGADMKALVVLAVAFPATPEYIVPTAVLPGVAWIHNAVFPLYPSTLGVTAMSALTNGVLLGAAFVLSLGVRNALAGRISPAMFVGEWTDVRDLPDRHGSLLDADGPLPSRGLDLDALRMYLRWRRSTLEDLRADPARHRDPVSVTGTGEPTDGAVHVGPRTDGGVPAEGDVSNPPGTADSDGPATATETAEFDDPWAAERFLDSIEGTAYGTDPETLREGLETVSEADAVWVSPGLPFVVPLFLGLVVSLTFGDVLTLILAAGGLL
ncbi:prepilin peptidase [Halorarum halophilum]|uniref:Prepilin peptidase n=1 Tax=Halorarum halophilum TaxID=2743090 RepID=A0A7D5KGH9_9EURY|nr:A24 family peptidase [Halobaculum halophilum]QLG28336.1 prepilin peptidase [Halobaculum halophilum]